MNDTLKSIDNIIALEKKFLPRFPVGSSQHSLLQNRILALQSARNLISGERRPTREELEFVLPRIESILHKTSKARDKFEPSSPNYKRLDPTVQTMVMVRTAILQVLKE